MQMACWVHPARLASVPRQCGKVARRLLLGLHPSTRMGGAAIPVVTVAVLRWAGFACPLALVARKYFPLSPDVGGQTAERQPACSLLVPSFLLREAFSEIPFAQIFVRAKWMRLHFFLTETVFPSELR